MHLGNRSLIHLGYRAVLQGVLNKDGILLQECGPTRELGWL
jgi:hypothetical protein